MGADAWPEGDLVESIWKLNSPIPEQMHEGQVTFMYMLSCVMRRTLYLGKCRCKRARHWNTPIISFDSDVPCAYCGEDVKLDPLPRPEDGKWIIDI